jgi:hypothetical protein
MSDPNNNNNNTDPMNQVNPFSSSTSLLTPPNIASINASSSSSSTLPPSNNNFKFKIVNPNHYDSSTQLPPNDTNQTDKVKFSDDPKEYRRQQQRKRKETIDGIIGEELKKFKPDVKVYQKDFENKEEFRKEYGKEQQKQIRAQTKFLLKEYEKKNNQVLTPPILSINSNNDIPPILSANSNNDIPPILSTNLNSDIPPAPPIEDFEKWKKKSHRYNEISLKIHNNINRDNESKKQFYSQLVTAENENNKNDIEKYNKLLNIISGRDKDNITLNEILNKFQEVNITHTSLNKTSSIQEAKNYDNTILDRIKTAKKKMMLKK